MAFVGSDWNAYIELVFDLEEHPPYAIGNRYEHLALEVDGDMKGTIERLRSQGVKILTEPKKPPAETAGLPSSRIRTASRSSCWSRAPETKR